jgi:hypothetical protein
LKLITPRDHAASAREVHASHRQAHVKPVSAPLHVFTMISNPMRFRSRYALYQAFEKMVADAGATLWTVEVALRDRHHEITSHDNPHHLQLRSPSVLWIKENAQNVLVRHAIHVDASIENLLFLDADTQFARSDWAVELVHLLQLHPVVQPWSHNISLGPNNQPISDATSFFYNWVNDEAILQPVIRGNRKPQSGFKAGHHDKGNHCHCDGDGSYVHPPHPTHEPPVTGGLHTGYGLAMRRSVFSDMGGLGDIGILGSGDRQMLYSFVGEVEKSLPQGIHPSYRDYWLRYQARAEKYVRRGVGYMDGLILDGWHAAKIHRQYQTRWRVLVDCDYQWQRDTSYDAQGLLHWTGANPRLERACVQYFKIRNEDSIDL